MKRDKELLRKHHRQLYRGESKMMPLVQRASDRLEFGRGGFQIRRVLPGLCLQNANDPGFGPLGAFDHARLQPGGVVAMHQHRNDEIFSYMRKGTMLHQDTSGGRLPLTPTHLAVMNAGSGMWHEERVPEDGEPVEMLQIFVRPREDELPPNFQHREFPQTESLNAWRLLTGPEQSNAPFTLRNAVWIHDAHLDRASLRTPSSAGLDGHLYVFQAEISANVIALHHLDAPWRPADVEQREGRILRQGNKNAVVQIYRYVSEGSFDAYMWQTLETKAKFIAQVMSGDMTIRRLEDLDSAALTYAEVKAIASGNPLVIEKAQVDAELMRLTRLRSAHSEEQYRIRRSLLQSREDAEAFTMRLANLRQDISIRQDMSGDNFHIELDGQTINNRGIAGELIVRRAAKLQGCFGDDVRIGRFAGFDVFLRPALNSNVEIVVRGKNSYSARVTDTALGTIRSLETTVQGFEERATKLEADIVDCHKRAKELEGRIGAPFEHEKRHQELTFRQGEIEEKLDLTKNQAPSQADAEPAENIEEKNSQAQEVRESARPKRRVAMRV